MTVDKSRLLYRARKLGADIAGVTRIEPLQEARAILRQPLADARSVIVLGVRQSFGALDSPLVQMAQHDTMYAYAKVDDVSHSLVRVLEDAGHAAVAVPAFLPIDMSDDFRGMLGEVDHRRAAVEAGLGAYGLSNLLITEAYGPRVRLASILTTASIAHTRPLKKRLCIECGRCVEACPANALIEPGTTDKRACGRTVFEYGLRGLIRFGFRWIGADEGEETELLRSQNLRELWQNFMTGMYYTCFQCQAACSAGSYGRKRERKGPCNSS